MEESFIKSQVGQPKFYISKYKYDNYITKTVNNKKWVPGCGAYDHNKGTNLITKGLSRGWK